MNCPKCGKVLKAGEKFCGACGEKTDYADKENGSIIFKRDNNFFGCAIPFKIFINGESKGTISTGGTVKFEYPLGEYEIAINSPKDKSKMTINLTKDKKEIIVNVGVKIFALSFVAKGKIKKVQ